ncbi:hypothetical protein J0X19_14185 [Hymenobacter sp. BT186]|uniref:SMI1/KNR4 family protein n=1 Tax=Hymenobacter telluris TaxID=2816474 RepID=A0A939EYX5_9BACT|nr:hypothetical protein [Hymenobacter telluris]MBO0359105.1 hypothetical protein [Hymenobacter telluris]MBW3375131.1 hypothetical protein [Hymenobacter norwichensis]
MLSEKVKQYLVADGNAQPQNSVKQQYADVLLDLNIPLDSELAEFHLSTIGPTFTGRLYELYHICWNTIYSSYDLDLDRTWNMLGLPKQYIPLDGFEAEGGFFYDRHTGAVVEVELGEKLTALRNGTLQPQWATFNEFLEWYFKLT